MFARWLLLLVSLLSGCATYDGGALQVGQTTTDEIVQRMGPPVLRWAEPTGGETLVYPRGPYGFQTFFVRTDGHGNFVQREQVLDAAHFSRIQPGMTTDQVIRTLGPSVAAWTVYFAARDELVWEWRFCDDWNEPARFNVLFDGRSMTVRSTQAATEQLRGFGDDQHRQWCGH